MKNVKQSAPLALIAIALAVAPAACSAAASRPSGSLLPAAQAQPTVALIGGTDSSFTNSVPETPWWQALPPTPQPPKPVSLAWNLSGDVLFDSGSATLSTAANSQLAGILNSAMEHPGASILVVGYTDNVPDPAFPGGNVGLSQARAANVASIISSAHIPNDHVTSNGMGSADPVADESTPAGQQACRRVTISLTVQ